MSMTKIKDKIKFGKKKENKKVEEKENMNNTETKQENQEAEVKQEETKAKKEKKEFKPFKNIKKPDPTNSTVFVVTKNAPFVKAVKGINKELTLDNIDSVFTGSVVGLVEADKKPATYSGRGVGQIEYIGTKPSDEVLAKRKAKREAKLKAQEEARKQLELEMAEEAKAIEAAILAEATKKSEPVAIVEEEDAQEPASEEEMEKYFAGVEEEDATGARKELNEHYNSGSTGDIPEDKNAKPFYQTIKEKEEQVEQPKAESDNISETENIINQIQADINPDITKVYTMEEMKDFTRRQLHTILDARKEKYLKSDNVAKLKEKVIKSNKKEDK
jgi:hypothetical protein